MILTRLSLLNHSSDSPKFLIVRQKLRNRLLPLIYKYNLFRLCNKKNQRQIAAPFDNYPNWFGNQGKEVVSHLI